MLQVSHDIETIPEGEHSFKKINGIAQWNTTKYFTKNSVKKKPKQNQKNPSQSNNNNNKNTQSLHPPLFRKTIILSIIRDCLGTPCQIWWVFVQFRLCLIVIPNINFRLIPQNIKLNKTIVQRKKIKHSTCQMQSSVQKPLNYIGRLFSLCNQNLWLEWRPYHASYIVEGW